MRYCESISKTKRWHTRVVMVGNVGVGGDNPVRIQSMTTSDTRDVQATVDQIKRLADVGCEIARVTVQGMKEADACEQIKNQLVQAGYMIPLVADIHFFPPAALRVADFVDKVRVNPGNFVDKRATFRVIEYNDASYAEELERIDEKFSPLVLKCKSLKRSMRIGTNHGSLSDRIMNRFGDTPQGMVESALEFARVCRKYDYHDFMFSMKASNPLVMVLAYRLLVAEMMKLGWDYPLHLGVTEAGEGEDGRVKSAMGIGALLLDGLGDTIRVSLTEDPWYEIEPCKRLVAFAEHYESLSGVKLFEEKHRDIEHISRTTVILPSDLAFHRDGTVVLSVNEKQILSDDFFQQIGCDVQLGQPKLKRDSADILWVESSLSDKALQKLRQLKEIGVSLLSTHLLDCSEQIIPLGQAAISAKFSLRPVQAKGILVTSEEDWKPLIELAPSFIIIKPAHANRFQYARSFFEWMRSSGLTCPVILCAEYQGDTEDLTLQSASELGALLSDAMGDGIALQGDYPLGQLRKLSFSILQAARMRTTKTDFISCPSCGRTLFNLQDVTARIRARTAHLPGVKIAIMGCIVNGPGEMADADFGYVGSKPGKIDLYVGKTCVEKGIDFADADDRLVALIKEHGRWEEPPETLCEAAMSVPESR